MGRTTEDPLLIKGSARYQIFETGPFIFKVSSALEKLYRYKFDPATNEVIEIIVFKYVRNSDPEYAQLRQLQQKIRFGNPTVFRNKIYGVYKLASQKYVRGYMLYPRTVHGNDQTVESQRLYFTFEKYEKKGR